MKHNYLRVLNGQISPDLFPEKKTDKQVEISRKIEVSNRKKTLQNRKIELTFLNADCSLYFAPNVKISVFVHEVIEVHIVNNVG